MDFLFILNAALLGVGLAMDAFSVSLANGLHEPDMGWARAGLIAGTFGFFQWLMPMVGWYCVHTIVNIFRAFEPYIPWIALVLLLYIGGGMIREGFSDSAAHVKAGVGYGALFVQGVATSIDALSVGFTIEKYDFPAAMEASLIIATVTFVICVAGIQIGKKFGTKLADKATVLGGVILIGIGVHIFFSA